MNRLKRTFALLLCVCMITAFTGCDAPAGKESGASKQSAEPETKAKPAFNNKVEISFVKIGSDTLGIALTGAPCADLTKKGTFEASDREILIVIGEEKEITVPREEFADYGIEEEDEEVISYDITTYDPKTYIYLYSMDSSILVANGDDWDNYKCDFNDGNTAAGPAAYFTKITSPGICDRIEFKGILRAFAFEKNKDDDLSEEFMIAEGDVSKYVKSMTKDAFEETAENPVFSSWTVKKAPEAAWAGEWVSDGSFGVTDAEASVTVSDTGAITWKMTIDGEVKYWFGEENTYVFTEREFSDLTEAGTELYNFRNGSSSCFITYAKSDSKEENGGGFEKLEFKYDVYGEDRASKHVTFVRKTEQ